MAWQPSHRFDKAALPLADRHYSRRKPGSPQFVALGRNIVLVAGAEGTKALWVSHWPKPEFVKHAWATAWTCSLFRNEGAGLSSELIREAVEETVARWGAPPTDGFVTFVNAKKTRRKRDPGRCFRKAGWLHVGFTKGGLYVFQLPPAAIDQQVIEAVLS